MYTHMCTYIYIYIYIHVYRYVYTGLVVYIYIYTYIHGGHERREEPRAKQLELLDFMCIYIYNNHNYNIILIMHKYNR